MKTILLAALLLFSACNVYEPPGKAAPPNNPCGVVECRWTNDTECLEGSLAGGVTLTQTQYFDAEAGCWVYQAACVPRGTSEACTPDKCRREYVTCPEGQP